MFTASHVQAGRTLDRPGRQHPNRLYGRVGATDLKGDETICGLGLDLAPRWSEKTEHSMKLNSTRMTGLSGKQDAALTEAV